jgi:hypothetical protein
MREHHKTADAMERIVAAPRAKVYAPLRNITTKSLNKVWNFHKTPESELARQSQGGNRYSQMRNSTGFEAVAQRKRR